MPRPHNGRSVFIIVRTYAFAFGIWLTSDRLTSIPSTWKCGTAYSFTRKKPGLSSISSTTTLASRSGWEACSSSPGSVISVTRLRTRGVQLQLQQTPVLGGADIFALDHLQVVRDARQQEDVRQTRVDTAVGGGVGGIVQRRFLRGVGREEAGVIAIFVVRQRDKARLANSNSRVSGIITSEGIHRCRCPDRTDG